MKYHKMAIPGSLAMGDFSSIFGSVVSGAGNGVTGAENAILGSILGSVAQNPTVQQAAAAQASQSAATGLVNFYNQHQMVVWGGVALFGGLMTYLILRK